MAADGRGRSTGERLWGGSRRTQEQTKSWERAGKVFPRASNAFQTRRCTCGILPHTFQRRMLQHRRPAAPTCRTTDVPHHRRAAAPTGPGGSFGIHPPPPPFPPRSPPLSPPLSPSPVPRAPSHLRGGPIKSRMTQPPPSRRDDAPTLDCGWLNFCLCLPGSSAAAGGPAVRLGAGLGRGLNPAGAIPPHDEDDEDTRT